MTVTVKVAKIHLVPGHKGYDVPTADGAIFQVIRAAVYAAVANPTTETVAYARVKTVEAKVLTTEVAIQATNKLFELAFTRATLAEHKLDRPRRKARTHMIRCVGHMRSWARTI